ncbi:pyrimidine dimer DNA glycosylase/endonuclease V [Microbacterium sp.]|uniref:pyrimidine dimer DNA glycosylase/endonuclease V n=1 Tax=Microbacterium sp. TaxID=51671 RepID=UPI002811AD4E|nr:pyrimidine dimer DNA glycosylase/endonuclease V [Microbacterium sp.]
MRLWSLHPELLDRQGLTAAWREALLAQAVLLGRTRGYTKHPQLERFRAHEQPTGAIASYLSAIAADAARRGYRFDVERIAELPTPGTTLIPVTEGQVAFEWEHLLRKLSERSPAVHEQVVGGSPLLHPMFVVVPGDIEPWERP